MVEVLVVLSIITVSILAAMIVTQKSVSVSRASFQATQAAFILEEGAEALRILRDNAWTNISSLNVGTNYYLKFTSGTWTTSSTSADGIVDIFTRSISIANVNRDNSTKDISGAGTNDPDTKLVTITVSWPEGGTITTKTLQFYIINIFS